MSVMEEGRAAIRAFPGELVTPRLRLAIIRPEDGPVLLDSFNDWEVMRWLGTPPWPVVPAESLAHFSGASARWHAGDDATLAIHADGRPLGLISWRMREQGVIGQSGDGPNLGFWIGRASWGKGYMTEAAGALIDHIFSQSPMPAIYAGLFDGNVGSQRVQEKLGFEVESRNSYWCNPQQRELPHLNMRLTRATWEAGRGRA